MMSNEGRGGAMIDLLSEGCIANVVSLMSTRDACRLSLVASLFRLEAESNGVWETFPPSDYKDFIRRAVDSSSFLGLLFTSKKQLYLWLFDNSLIIDNGTKPEERDEEDGGGGGGGGGFLKEWVLEKFTSSFSI
ncbi:hypothetical protein ACSBR1_033620 [Camellia fascicularis]